MIKVVHIVSLPDVTQLHISLVPKRLPCPYCHGVTHLNGYSKPKVINHPKLTDKNASSFSKITVINVTSVSAPSLDPILSPLRILKTLISHSIIS